MSTGPVYCPNDKTELGFFVYPNCSGFSCPKCGLVWDGQFPIRDNPLLKADKKRSQSDEWPYDGDVWSKGFSKLNKE